MFWSHDVGDWLGPHSTGCLAVQGAGVVHRSLSCAVGMNFIK